MSTETAAYGGQFSNFGFVDDRSIADRVGIGKIICVGYKSGFQISEIFLRKMIDNSTHLIYNIYTNISSKLNFFYGLQHQLHHRTTA